MTPMRSLMLAMLCCGCAAGPAPAEGTVKIGEVTWHTDYDTALAEAKRVKKPLWLHFGENPG